MALFEFNHELHRALPNTVDEALFELAVERPQAMLWQGSKGLVVPRSYAQSPLFEQCQQQLNHQGWPISIRQSGGGVVPQGPGIWNLSLAWCQYGKPLDMAEHAYVLLCQSLQHSLTDCGIRTTTQAVQGSFCDGRFNLAVQHQGQHKKVVGTAQVWRRSKTPPDLESPPRQAGNPAAWHVVLAHALVLIDIDAVQLSHYANEVEIQLQKANRYQAQRICSLTELGLDPQLFTKRLKHHLSSLSAPSRV